MARVTVEDFVPYDRSIRWQLQDAYFRGRGVRAWTSGDIPWLATSNLPLAKQHVRFVADLVRELQPDGAIDVVEIGSGHGAFAASFLRAIDASRRAVDKDLAKRLRYVMTDWNAESIGQAAARADLRKWTRAGRLVPAVWDVRYPDRLTGLDGGPFAVAPKLVFANYVACVIPPKILHKSPLGWLERHAKVTAEGESTEDAWAKSLDAARQPDELGDVQIEESWRPIDLEAALGAIQADAARATLATLREGTVVWPGKFLDWLGVVAKEAVVVITDFGQNRTAELSGLRKCEPRMYGQAASHPVDFPLLDAFGTRLGFGVVRTRDPMRSVQIAVVAPFATDRLTKPFDAAYRRQVGEELLDLQIAARTLHDKGDNVRAYRIYARCLKLDPTSIDALYGYAMTCLDLGFAEPALKALDRAKRIDTARYDFDFAVGRAHARLGDHARAIAAYHKSLAIEEHPATHVNLGLVYEAKKDVTMARAHFARALILNPDDAFARERLESIRG